jgi:hypothetical protein
MIPALVVLFICLTPSGKCLNSSPIKQYSCHINKALQKQALGEFPEFQPHHGGALKMDRAPFWPWRTHTLLCRTDSLLAFLFGLRYQAV